MKNRMNSTSLMLGLFLCASVSAMAQTTAFTYQGYLAENGNPVNGIYDLQFTLQDAATNQVGNVVTVSSVTLTNGLFTVPLDFGANAFDGSARWLEIAVRQNEPPGPPPAYVTLSPRQPITVAPYALRATTAATASGLSTVGNQPLEFFVNNIRVMRLEASTSVPNVIGGSSLNSAAPGVVGATILGGGSLFPPFGLTRVESSYGTIGGGADNTIGINSVAATIAGGQGNNIYGASVATISGGDVNLILTNASGATISGGQDNQVGANATWATIPGGFLAKATSYGQLAYASGGFAGRNISGMAQSSLFVLRRYTTNSVPTELFLDGGEVFPGIPTGGRRMMLSNNGAWLFDAIVIARSSTGDCAGFQIKNMIKNVDGTTSLVDVSNVTRLPSDPTTATWNVTVEADDTNDALVIKVTGANSTTIRWVASVRTVEVIF